jgi:hypothetical protein
MQDFCLLAYDERSVQCVIVLLIARAENIVRAIRGGHTYGIQLVLVALIKVNNIIITAQRIW